METLVSGLKRTGEEPHETSASCLLDLGKIYLQLIGQDPEKIYPLLSDVHFWDPKYLEPEGTEWGMDTMDAFRCLIDVNRTLPLLEGIAKTVESQRNAGHDRVVAIDAGTGTGILSIGLVAAGCDKVFALEINPLTAQVAKKFIGELGLSDRIEVVLADATQIDMGDLKAQVLVSENLASGLFNEPQYQIINHLSQFMSKDGKVVPYKTRLFVSMGFSTWQDKTEFELSSRKLIDLKQLSSQVPYFETTSRVGPQITHVAGTANIIPQSTNESINTLIISSQFQIDDGPNPSILQPDCAEFLGRSHAFRLPATITPFSSSILVSLYYPVGMPKKHFVATIPNNNTIFLTGPNRLS
jgi:16S rRNA G966 N2-methylase RsmD